MTPHVDDEALSALLDGEATTAEEAHAATCSACSQRLAQLRAVVGAVGDAPAPATAARRDAAITTALAAGKGSRAPAGDAAPVAAPVPMAAPGRPGRRWDRLPSWAAAAAGVAVLAASVTVLGLLAGQVDRGEPTAAGRSGAEVADDLAAGSSVAPPPVDGGNLGDLAVEEVEELARRIEQQRLAPQAPRREQSQAPPHSAAADGDAADSATGGNHSTTPTECEAAARGRDPALGRLVYAAEATIDGTPASILGFEAPPAPASDPGTLRVLALATATCTELAAAAG